jgi:tRNA(fMet)-specific endonuclease VapC
MKMTGNKFLLDTNIIVAWFNGELSIADKIDKAKEVHIPIIVVGELYYGAANSIQIEKNIKNIQNLTNRYHVLQVDIETTKYYGDIKAALRKKGKPIPENDIWIAAIAQQHKLTLVTRDKHFKEIEVISLKTW